ncbi:MAG: lysophospholipase [Saprospiraceae bacterium]|nr:lysophospholipase [Saprospiraceae bacterium]
MEQLHWINAEGLQLYAANWSVNNPRAVIALVHGQGEHIGRYDFVARWFNEHGIALIGYDQQGYGRSQGKRGHAINLDVLLNDIGLLLEKTCHMYPNLPVFLLGQSMGGGLVLNYVTRRKPELAGLIALAPWIRLAFEAPALKIVAGKILKRFMPTLTLPTGLAAHFLSHEEAVVKAYKSDPLVHDKLSAAAGIALLEAAKWLDLWAGEFNIPVLLQHGGDDKITSADATRRFFERAKGDVTHREWAGLYHEIHNEKEKEEVHEYTLKWIESKIK